MPPFQSRIDPESEAFRRNRADMLALIDEFRALEARVRDASARSADRFAKRGQILPRERVARLLDRGAPFLELSTLAGWRLDDDDPEKSVPGGNHIVGIGYVSDVRCMVVATDSGINAGAIGPMGREKLMRAQDIALENKLPFVHLVESAGANLLRYKVEGFVAGGGIFYNLARLSAAGVPVVTVLHGSSTAGGAYMPGLADYVVMVRGRAKAFLAGPPLLKAATGEIATDEELGGADMHASVSGLAEYVAEDDTDGLRIARDIVARLDWRPPRAGIANATWREPRYAPDELAGVVPIDVRKPYDVREVLARVVDDSDFLEFKSRYGSHTVCAHAAVAGQPVAFIGNNGPIDNNGATKAAQFIQLCCQSNTPIVYLQNTTGYMVGRALEAGGMIKHGSKMIQAVSNATVPQITFMIGASYGAGNYGMCGRAYNPRFLFSWPNARMAVMGPEQAAMTMSIVTEAGWRRKGETVDKARLKALEKEIIDHFEAQSGALHATARLLDDGIIDPRDSRKVLALVLSVSAEAAARTVHPVTFGVARM